MLRVIAAIAGLLMVLAATAGSRGADISVVSMEYSTAYPVPHLHYEGETEAGDVDKLATAYDTYVKCRLSCIGPDGGATAILTLDGPGGNYIEGLHLAQFLRDNHIATVVERGMECYSACAFAFLGGTGYSPQQGVGDFVDRMVEPGSTVGFHAPYYDAADFAKALEQEGGLQVQGYTRDDLSLMVAELVKWNVDPEIMSQFINKGPDQTYNLHSADELYFARASLPPTRTTSWITDLPTAVKNACTYLLAVDEHGDPWDMQDRFLSDYAENIGNAGYDGAISGYTLGDAPLSIGMCGITETALKSDGDYDVSLFYTPGIDGTNGLGTSLFNRQQGWSSAGTGHDPAKRIFQKGPLNYFYLPLGVPIDDLDLPGEAEIDANRFNDILPPELPTLPVDLTVTASTKNSRISQVGNIWVFEQVGHKPLYDAAVDDGGLGRTYTNNAAGPAGFIREGTFDDTGAAFSRFGFLNGDDAAVVTAFVADGQPTPDDIKELQRLQCAFAFEGLALKCGG